MNYFLYAVMSGRLTRPPPLDASSVHQASTDFIEVAPEALGRGLQGGRLNRPLAVHTIVDGLVFPRSGYHTTGGFFCFF